MGFIFNTNKFVTLKGTKLIFLSIILRGVLNTKKKTYFCHQNNQLKMTSAESIKLHLITQIASLDDATVLAQLAHILKQHPTKNNDILKKLSTPRRKKLDIE